MFFFSLILFSFGSASMRYKPSPIRLLSPITTFSLFRVQFRLRGAFENEKLSSQSYDNSIIDAENTFFSPEKRTFLYSFYCDWTDDERTIKYGTYEHIEKCWIKLFGIVVVIVCHKRTTTDYSIDAPYAFETNWMYQSLQRWMRFDFQSFADDRWAS